VRDAVRGEACLLLKAGKVRVCSAGPDNSAPPEYVRARVEGRSSTRFVRLSGGRWLCSCDRPESCEHVAAVQLVTGHDGLARKPERAG